MRTIPLAMLSTLAACTTVSPGGARIDAGSRYVAMGSSFAAGPQLGNLKPDTPKRCARDQGNYATLLAARLQLDLIDVSCSGATTAHLLRPWDELPAQLDAVTPDTRLVTITIGGNDVNFVHNLYLSGCDGSKRTCPPQPIPTEATWAQLEANLREIAHQVRSRAPAAKLVFVDYVTLVPKGKTCPAVPYSAAAVANMRGMAARLAQVTAMVAHETGADLFPAGSLSETHTPCDPEPWSVGMPGTGQGAPWHPNAAGMRAIADQLGARLVRR